MDECLGEVWSAYTVFTTVQKIWINFWCLWRDIPSALTHLLVHNARRLVSIMLYCHQSNNMNTTRQISWFWIVHILKEAEKHCRGVVEQKGSSKLFSWRWSKTIHRTFSSPVNPLFKLSIQLCFRKEIYPQPKNEKITNRWNVLYWTNFQNAKSACRQLQKKAEWVEQSVILA